MHGKVRAAIYHCKVFYFFLKVGGIVNSTAINMKGLLLFLLIMIASQISYIYVFSLWLYFQGLQIKILGQKKQMTGYGGWGLGVGGVGTEELG